SIYTHVAPSRSLCGGRKDLDTGIYMIDAHEIKKFADGAHGRKVSLDAMLRRSNPFHCMFCCPMSLDGNHFQSYFGSPTGTEFTHGLDKMPAYAQRLLHSRDEQGSYESSNQVAEPEKFPPVRTVGIYDLRDCQ